jgi:hypothetical protein
LVISVISMEILHELFMSIAENIVLKRSSPMMILRRKKTARILKSYFLTNSKSSVDDHCHSNRDFITFGALFLTVVFTNSCKLVVLIATTMPNGNSEDYELACKLVLWCVNKEFWWTTNTYLVDDYNSCCLSNRFS